MNKDVEELGVKVLYQWFLLGPHDFVNIVEASDLSSIAKVSGRSSAGERPYRVVRMLDVDDLLELLAGC